MCGHILSIFKPNFMHLSCPNFSLVISITQIAKYRQCSHHVIVLWATMALSVWHLTTGRMVWGSNPSEGKIFSTCPDRPWGPPSLMYNRYQVSYLQGKAAWCGIDHPPPSSTEVNKRVVLYLYRVSEP